MVPQRRPHDWHDRGPQLLASAMRRKCDCDPLSGHPFCGTDEVDLVAAAAEAFFATEVLTVDAWIAFFFGGGAKVSLEVFLFGLLTTAAEPEVIMSETFTTALETNIII